MHHILRVHVLDSRESLTEKLESFCLAYRMMLVLISKKSAILCELHDHVNFTFLNESIPKFDDMWVIDGCMQVDLSLEQQTLVLADSWTNIDLGYK